MAFYIENLKKKIGNFLLSVERLKIKDKFFGIFGPSGSGKTTFLRIIAGLEIPDEGLIKFKRKTFFSSYKKINLPPENRNVSMVFQEISLWPTLKVKEQLKVVCENDKEIKRIAKKFGIESLLEKKVSELSRGEKQRVEICRALLAKPEILLLDEPFASIDLETQQKLIKEIKNFVITKKIFSITVSHNPLIMKKFCKKVGLIKDGKIKKVVRNSYFSSFL